MSLPERYSCKLLVLLYLSACIIAVAKAGTNETSTTTTTAKPEASLPEAESSLVETSVNLEGQETRTKSASHGYSESGKSYLPQESIYHSYPHEEQVYEYGKRIAGPYKGNIDSIYHVQQEQAHYPQSEYIDSHRHYEQQQLDDYGHSSGKGTPYQQVKVQADSYGKDDYGHSDGKGIAYSQVKIQGDSYGKKFDDYGHSIDKGTPYPHGKSQDDSYGKEHVDDYGHSSGKGISYQHAKIQDDSYGKEHLDDYGHSSGKGTPYQQEHLDDYGHSSGKELPKIQINSQQQEHLDDYGHSSGKGTPYQQEHLDAYGHSSGKGTPYQQEHLDAYGHSSGKGTPYQQEHLDAYGHSSGKGTPYQQVKIQADSYGKEDYGKHGKSYSNHKPVDDTKAPYLKYSYEVPKKQYVSGDHYDVKDYGGSAGYGSEDNGYHGKSHDEGAYGKGGSKGYSYLIPDFNIIRGDFKAAYGTSSGKSAYDGNSKSAYGGHPKSTIIPHGGHAKSEVFSYGGDSKSHYDEKENYNHGGHSYEPQYEKESSYGHAPVAQYHKEPLIYEGGKSSSAHVSDYGINGNAKYINAQEYGHQKSYGKGGETSYEAAIPHKGASYGKEGPSIDVHSYSSGHPSSKGSYDGITVVKSSSAGYGKRHNSGPVKGKGYSQGHGYENQKSYGAEVVSPYVASSGEKYSQQGKGFPAVSYGSFTPIINPYGSVVDFSRSASKKSVSSKSHGSGYKSAGLQDGYGHSKQSSSYRRPKSFAVILQRAHGGHSDSYGSPSYSANIKGGSKSLSHGYSEQGFKPIIPKHGGISEYYNLHSYGSSPRYSAIPHPKSSSRKN
ncbi:Stress protein DDR48 like protein [Argiope bruennichi]|uniref:Stress protein DDR48 like protein n=1 Tax=Argiope bruennichi TaxID=94029 RepID=A0A8T0EX71_ARGBR|nr:Stress protein DDR48 like protein [Argiope bruennichi]